MGELLGGELGAIPGLRVCAVERRDKVLVTHCFHLVLRQVALLGDVHAALARQLVLVETDLRNVAGHADSELYVGLSERRLRDFRLCMRRR